MNNKNGNKKKLTIKNLSILQVSMPDQWLAIVLSATVMNFKPVLRSIIECTSSEMVSARSSWIKGLSDIHMQ